MHCSLTQEIPYYGRAVFEKRSGGKLDFYIAARQQPRTAGMAKLVSAAPAWKHDTMVRDLGSVDYTPSGRTFRLGEVVARRLLLELEQGMYPTFSYKDWADGRDQVQVALSSVNVRSALGDFLACLDNQIGFTLDDVRISRIHFGFNSTHLSENARGRLDMVAEYILADPAVRQVTLEGLTDNVGYRRYNLALAKRRATAVQDYLVSKGVKKSRFRITSIGERYPVASNRTAKGRASNRLVLVTLMK
jgi:outer membrane protein OmpA-like peptidoglycan-associated protein